MQVRIFIDCFSLPSSSKSFLPHSSGWLSRKTCHQQGLYVTTCGPALGLPGFCGRNSLAFPLEGGVLLLCSILLLLAKHLLLWWCSPGPCLVQPWGAVSMSSERAGLDLAPHSCLGLPGGRWWLPRGTQFLLRDFFSPLRVFSSRTWPHWEQPLICTVLDNTREQKKDGTRGLPFAIERAYQEKKKKPTKKEREDCHLFLSHLNHANHRENSLWQV